MVLLELLTAQPPALEVRNSKGRRSYTFLRSRINNNVSMAMSLADPNAEWPLHVSDLIAQLSFLCTWDREDMRPNFINNLKPRLRILPD